VDALEQAESYAFWHDMDGQKCANWILVELAKVWIGEKEYTFSNFVDSVFIEHAYNQCMERVSEYKIQEFGPNVAKVMATSMTEYLIVGYIMGKIAIEGK
jgi:hypothetical protein